MNKKPLRFEKFKKELAKDKLKAQNLNHFNIPADRYHMRDLGGQEAVPSEDYSTKINSPKFDTVETHFRNIEDLLINKIIEYKNDLIIGCVAWLTSFRILDALAQCKNVQIVVQKEDFLRPDIETKDRNDWKNTLRNKYLKIKCEMGRYQFAEPMKYLSFACDSTVEGIRCVGNHNSEKNPAFPRMHNKFLVFCKTSGNENSEDFNYWPVSLWTGSFNLTQNATYSLENVICLTDESGKNELIKSYLNEHHQIFSISENLNWESNWIEPEFRIGT
jgi:hypothetical protein